MKEGIRKQLREIEKKIEEVHKKMIDARTGGNWTLVRSRSSELKDLHEERARFLKALQQ